MMARRGETGRVSGLPRVAREVVDRHVHRLAAAQRLDVPHEKIRLQRIRMIVVERRPLLEPQVVAVAIVAIVLEDGHLIVADALDDPPHDGGLAGA